MDAEEVTKLVDGVYKNILEKFNPGVRQLITAGKGYFKALHGAASASRLFNEALAKIALNAQQSGTNDIGAALMNVVSVYKEIQDQQLNIVKAFYVDVLVPLETNLERDTKVVQHEQKKFMQQHKVRMESYQKAVSTMKKQRKKKATPENTEKELRSLQLLDDQKKKLDTFCDQSYKNALTEERRRYGFVLERQCSISKHWMAYHTTGRNVIDSNLENWEEIAATREIIPAAAYDSTFNGIGSKRMERIKDIDGSHAMGGPNGSSSQLKKARSVDAPYGDMRTLHENSTNYAQNSLPRAKSDFNLTTASLAASNEHADHHGHWDQRPVVKALYAYMPSGENQLPFEEGDSIALVGSKAKGWQFGENVRTQMFGWFPIAYTNAADCALDKRHASMERERKDRYENMHYERNGRSGGGGGGGAGAGGGVGSGGSGVGNGGMRHSYQDHQYMTESHLANGSDNALESDSTYRRRNNSAEESSPTRMFGDTINFRNQKKYRASTGANPRPGPPPTLPAPVPSVGQTTQSRILNSSQSFCASNGAPSVLERRKHRAQAPHSSSIGHMTGNGSTNAAGGPAGAGTGPAGGGQAKSATAAKTSLHSSNDSGFANEPPPQPEVDYSDEEQASRVPIRRRAETNSHAPREVASWTLNRNFRSSVDSHIDDKSLNAFGKSTGNLNGHGNTNANGNGNGNAKMRYDLIASDDEILQASSGGIKRTKSFWKFGGGRNEDILAGMALWQHRDLVAAPNLEELRNEEQQQQHQQQQARRDGSAQMDHDRSEKVDRDYDAMEKNGGTLTKSNSNNSSAASSRNEKHRKDSITSMEVYDDEDNIYGISPIDMRKESKAVVEQQSQQSQQRNSMSASAVMHANYTPKSRMKIMKTIEIDIESPTDNERLSTLKRGQKEYNRDANLLQSQQQHQQQQAYNSNKTNGNNKNKQQQQSQPKQMQRNNKASAGSGGMTGSGSLSGSGSQQHQSTTGQMKSSQQSNGRIKATQHDSMMMAMHSTEDEDASDDNGTLKMSDVNNFFDDIPADGINAAGMIMKTVKRKDILKQYYTSEDEESDDMEVNSTSSDPYDCIVINDHLVRKDEKYRRQQNLYHQEQQMEFQTFRSTTTKATAPAASDNVGTNKSAKKLSSKQQQHQQQHQQQQQQQQQQKHHMKDSEQRERYNGNGVAANGALNTPTATILPRTRLMKSSSSTLERTQQKSAARPNDVANGSSSASNEKERLQYSNKSYGPWYDFWDQQDHHTLFSQKSMNNSKMK